MNRVSGLVRRRYLGLGAQERRRRRTPVVRLAVLSVLASTAMLPGPPAAAVEASPPLGGSDLRIGVLAIADTIAAIGETPDLAEPLPFTRTSAADVLNLDDVLSGALIDAMSGNGNLEDALEEIPGIRGVTVQEGGDRISFAYEQEQTVDLELAHDDGNLRFRDNDGVGELTVRLATPGVDSADASDDGQPFVVEVDPDQDDPLLKVALVSKPQLELSIDIDNADIDAFWAREGFTEVHVTGGHYRIERDADITMRDPDGRRWLTLEDLRYSTLPDLFDIDRTTDEVDVQFDLELPDTVGVPAGESRTGTLSLTQPASVSPEAPVWPLAENAVRSYSPALRAMSDLSLADGITSLAQYTGVSLALQEAADVAFPNLAGSTTDLFHPGDDLLDMLATSAVAKIRCGLTPENPPSGIPFPGDTLYCDAVTADGLGEVTAASWHTDSGDIATTAGAAQLAAAGPRPTGVVQIDGSNGEPHVTVELTTAEGTFTARTMPRTIQDTLQRIREIDGRDESTAAADATVNLAANRVDVDVDLRQPTAQKQLAIGNPGTLGALVGLTGLEASTDARARTEATGSSYDVGFGLPFSDTDSELAERESIVLLPSDQSLLQIEDLSTQPPAAMTELPGRIGFLGVTADVTGLALGRAGSEPVVVALTRPDAAPLPLGDVLTEEGTLKATAGTLVSHLTASIGFTAKEAALPGGDFATGVSGGASGSASVDWAGGLPTVAFGPGYAKLRVFDPVPAQFLSGTAAVTSAVEGDSVEVTVDDGDLYTRLGVPAQADVEVARQLIGDGVGCQNVVLTTATTLTCEGLAPNGTAAVADGADVELIVVGDPFALRDGVIEGFAGALNAFDRLDSDNDPDDGLTDDQYASTLALVDLKPAQLAEERTSLARVLSDLVDAAAEDESGEVGDLPPVSSAQELSTAVATLVEHGGTLTYSLGTGRLGVALSGRTADDFTLKAPLRFFVDGTGQVVGDTDVAVDVWSATTLGIDVDTATARWSMGADSSTTSVVSLPDDVELRGKLQAGVGELEVVTSDSTAALDIRVATTYDPAGEVLQTRRTNDAGTVTDADATARIVVTGRDDPLVYSARAIDSSGGQGAPQPDPEPMEVKFLAEGLDGLGAALGSALDGAAPRNTGPDRAPVSAPLIGADLDAGAQVAERLTALTSLLRTKLATETAGVTTATALKDAVEEAVDKALADTGDEISGSAATASVTCGSPSPDCSGDGADGPTHWDTVTVTTTLQGAERAGTTPFQVGLAGLNVRSDLDVDTTTSWSVPVTLELVRGVGPQVRVNTGDELTIDVAANLPAAADVDPDVLGAELTGKTCDTDDAVHCLPAIVGYLPAMLTTSSETAGSVDLSVKVTPQQDAYDLFELYDGKLTAVPAFDTAVSEDGLALDFETVASKFGAFDMTGQIDVPWNPNDGFGEVEYTGVKLDVGEVIGTMAKPFAVVDPYLGPSRDVVNVLRTPVPVVSDLSELGDGGEVSMLSLLDLMGGADKRLDLAYRVISFIDAATGVVDAIEPLASEGGVNVEDLAAAGALLSIDPSEVELASSCTQTVRTTTTGGTTPSTTKKTTTPCPEEGAEEGVKDQTTQEKRKGTRSTKTSVAQTTASISGSAPGFSLPFLADPDQLVDVLTGEGEAAYFRLDFGSLVAKIAYTQSFGPIMAGPVPIKPFVGGSISTEGRLAVGFDSMAQTLAARQLSNPGDIEGLRTKYAAFQGGDILEEGFYIDDLDADGVDVPEVKLVTTLEAGAGVSIGIVTAGLKGGVIFTINLDLNDPNDDGRLRTAEIRDVFAGDAKCIFDASAVLEAFIAMFLEFDLFLTKLAYSFDLLRLGPYTLFEYGCPDVVPQLVVLDGEKLALTSGSRAAQHRPGIPTSIPEEYEVRQFDTGGGAAEGGTTVFEVTALNRVQRVEATASGDAGKPFTVKIFRPAVAASTDPLTTANVASLGFLASGGTKDDRLSFLDGETYVDDELVATSFGIPVTVNGGAGADIIVTGDGNDELRGEAGPDNLDAGLGDDVVTGGGENDVANGGAGRDDLDGGDGADHLEGGPGADRVVGGANNDSLTGGSGRDVRAVLVAAGDTDTEKQTAVEKQVRLGFDSGDVLIGEDGADTVDGADGSDVVVGGRAAALTGAELADLFEDGTRQVNVLYEGETNPRPQSVVVDTAKVPGAAQLDTLCQSGAEESAAAESDIVTGGPEADVVVGGNAADDLDGGGGPDEICGRAGDDEIHGDGGAPVSDEPGENDDVIRGGHGDDRIVAGAGDDKVFGDDVTLMRSGQRVLDGSLGGAGSSSGAGEDYLDGADGDDVLSGGAGSDQIVGGSGDDVTSGEGRDIAASGDAAPDLSDRLVACNVGTRVVKGYVDLDGDLLAGPVPDGLEGVTPDDGRLAGLEVAAGVVHARGSTTPHTGMIGDDVVVVDGRVDLNRDGATGPADTGTVPLPSMLGTTAGNPDGDCITGQDGEDRVFGGAGSDYVGGGAGADLVDGGDGNDLLLGDADTDVLLGGPHHDVLVGGLGDDHLLGGPGDDRLRGNEGKDDLVGGNDTSEEVDGQDVLLGGRGQDVLAGENATLVSDAIVSAVAETVWVDEPEVPATATADAESPLRFPDSAVACGTEPADRWVRLLVGGNENRVPAASPGEEPAYDELYGGYDCDWVFGQDGDDRVRGGQDDDIVEGGTGADTAYGDAGDDVVLGGSSLDPTEDSPVVVGRSGERAPDGGDTIYGDGGPDGEVGDDLLMGDNATPKRLPSGGYVVQLADIGPTGTDGSSGADTLYGGGPVEPSGPTRGTDRDRIFAQGGDDLVDAGADDDYAEGNSGADEIWGGTADDDLVGGSSAADGWPLGTGGARLSQSIAGPVDASAAGVPDEGDTIHGDSPESPVYGLSGEDTILGDNGRITRPGGTLTSATSTQAVRDVAMADTLAGPTSGSDELYGDAGDDVVYGQLDGTTSDDLGQGDRVDGGLGDDALLGDGGVVTLTPAGEAASNAGLSSPAALTSPADLITEVVYEDGTLVPVTEVPAALVTDGGNDIVRGGAGDDVLRLGGNRDLANGDEGDDVVLGGSGDDVVWGGTGHDRLFGGYGDDDLDLKPRTGDPTVYADVRTSPEDTDDSASTTNGADLAYGGWGSDELQADQGSGGPQPDSDHLVDWVGVHDVYYVCGGPYGAGRVIRQSSPAMMRLLSQLVVAAGGTDVGTKDSAGWNDLGLVTNADKRLNSSPSPEAPGNFTCEGTG